MGKGDCEDVSSAVDIQGDPANPPGPLVDELALGGRRGRGDLFGKVDGIEVASVANEHADAVDIGDEALIGCRLSRRRRRQGGGQAGQQRQRRRSTVWREQRARASWPDGEQDKPVRSPAAGRPGS